MKQATFIPLGIPDAWPASFWKTLAEHCDAWLTRRERRCPAKPVYGQRRGKTADATTNAATEAPAASYVPLLNLPLV